MASDTYRQDAVEAHKTQWLGHSRLAQPLSNYVVAFLAIIVITMLVAFAFLGSYTKKATVTGILDVNGGTLKILPAAGGTVLTVRVSEGSRVKVGDVMFVLSNERQSLDGATQATIGAQIKIKQAMYARDKALSIQRRQIREDSTRSRLKAIDDEIVQVRRELMINERRQVIARKNVDRFRELASTGFVASIQVQAKEDDALVMESQEISYQQKLANLSRERLALASQVDEGQLQSQTEEVEIERGLASLLQDHSENEARTGSVIVAPFEGVVASVAAHVGQVVSTNSLLAALVPIDAAMHAELYVSTRQSGFLAAGQPVHLRYAAFPYQKFGIATGNVVEVQRSPFAPQELPAQVSASLGFSAQATEPVYKVIVSLDSQTMTTYGTTTSLSPGMILEADVIQDKRQIYEWVLEPIYSISGRG